jgi:hypothetical protein
MADTIAISKSDIEGMREFSGSRPFHIAGRKPLANSVEDFGGMVGPAIAGGPPGVLQGDSLGRAGPTR